LTQNFITMKNILFLVLATFIFSCGKTTDNTETAEDTTKINKIEEKKDIEPSNIKKDTIMLSTPEYFKLFIKKLKLLSLPLSIRSTLAISSTELYSSKSTKINKDSYDALFVKDIGANSCNLCYGMLPDTSIFYSIILFYNADDLVPVLITFTKDGEKIAEVGLILHGCGAECGLDYCSSTGVIENDLSIYCADSINYAPCNDNNDKDESKREHYVDYKEGKINPDGSIQVSEEKHKDIIN